MRTDAVIPWVTLRSTEKADSRWDYDTLGWRWYRWNSDTSGAPVWRELHSIRQRQSIDDGLCQVCGGADADGWVAPPHYVDFDGTALTRTPAGVSRVPAGGEPAVPVPCAAGSANGGPTRPAGWRRTG